MYLLLIKHPQILILLDTAIAIFCIIMDPQSGPGLDHIFIQLGPTPPTSLSLPKLLAFTCVSSLLRWEPM